MSPDMQAAFELGAGFGVAELYRVITALVASSVFIWAAWVVVSVYLHWARGNEDRAHELGTSLIAVLIVVTLVVGVM